MYKTKSVNHWLLASCKSNGVLDVSAKIEIKYKINTGNNGTINQIDCCTSIIVVKLNEPEINIIIKTQELKINS